MTLIQPARWLRAALLIDAAGSLPVGLLQSAAPTWLAAQTGLGAPLLLGTGLFTVAYAALLVWLARKPRLPLATVRFIVIGNLGWAAACVAIAALAERVTPFGQAYLLLHVVAATGFAVLQGFGLARSTPVARLAKRAAMA